MSVGVGAGIEQPLFGRGQIGSGRSRTGPMQMMPQMVVQMMER